MIIYIDIDETICNTPENRDYSLASPIEQNIEKANKLYDDGNTIVYWTARGTVSGIDWHQTTLEQLISWGAKFHDLKLGKPHYDLFIDDKNMNTKDWQ
jgi:dTDP-glucose 4,6-dehydratase